MFLKKVLPKLIVLVIAGFVIRYFNIEPIHYLISFVLGGLFNTNWSEL